MKRQSTKHRWYFQKYRNYVMNRVKILPSKRYVPASFNDGYDENEELIFRFWYHGIAPSFAVIAFRVLKLERIPI